MHRKLVNVIVSCLQVPYMAKQAVDCRNMVRVKVWHTHTTVWLKPNSITLASLELAPNMFKAGSCQIPLH